MEEQSADGYGMRHNQDCSSNFGAMNYDPECGRCTKINKVIMLRRKNAANGCTQQESIAASVLATRIIEQFKLTRGEIADRAYDTVMVAKTVAAQQQYHNTYGSSKARHTYSRRPSGYTKMSGYNRMFDDSDLSDE